MSASATQGGHKKQKEYWKFWEKMDVVDRIKNHCIVEDVICILIGVLKVVHR